MTNTRLGFMNGNLNNEQFIEQMKSVHGTSLSASAFFKFDQDQAHILYANKAFDLLCEMENGLSFQRPDLLSRVAEAEASTLAFHWELQSSSKARVKLLFNKVDGLDLWYCQAQELESIKSTGDKLLISEQHLKLLLASSEDMITIHKTDGTYLYYNGPSCYPVKPEDLLGKTPYDFFSKDAADKIVGAFQEVAAGGPTKTLEVLLDWLGEKRWFSEYIYPIKNEQGEVTELVKVCRDINQRKITEDELIKSEKRFRAAFNSTASGMLLLTSDAEIIHVNYSFLNMTGFREHELEGRPLSLVVPDKDLRTLDELMTELMDARKLSVSRQLKLLDKNGVEFYAVVSMSKVNENQIVGQVDDITEKLKAEELQNRTQRLEALGVMAGGIAHDFNNLMATIYSSLDIIRLKSKDPNLQEDLDRCASTIDQARSMSERLLTYSKGGEPKTNVADVSDFLREVVALASAGRAMQISFDLPSDLWPARFDANQISQVVQNLVINAAQAQDNSGLLSIAAQNTTTKDGVAGLSPGSYVCLSFTDHGPGIPEELQSRIFDPFYTTKTNGSGLGLATAHRIVARHGGKIELDAKNSQQGATFHIYLPAAPHEPPQSVKTHQKISEAIGTGTILILDDNKNLVNVMKFTLEHLGFTAVGVHNSDDFFAELVRMIDEGETPLCAILDLTIPGSLNGDAVAREVMARKIEMPMFLMSGYTDNRIVTDYKDLGITELIPKPCKLDDLISILKKNLPRAFA